MSKYFVISKVDMTTDIIPTPLSKTAFYIAVYGSLVFGVISVIFYFVDRNWFCGGKKSVENKDGDDDGEDSDLD